MKKWLAKYINNLALLWVVFWMLAIAAMAVRYGRNADKALNAGTQACRCVCEQP